jgi:AhpD family alkylhydroperoxidase
MESARTVIDELRGPTASLRRAIPDVWEGFGAMHDAAMVDGALPGRHKELIALALAVVKRCDGCIAYHARGAARAGATPDEVGEALGVALLMDGGTASVYGPRAWQAYLEFAPPQAEIERNQAPLGVASARCT